MLRVPGRPLLRSSEGSTKALGLMQTPATPARGNWDLVVAQALKTGGGGGIFSTPALSPFPASREKEEKKTEKNGGFVIWPWVKIQIVPPVNIPIHPPIPTKMGSQNGFDNHSHVGLITSLDSKMAILNRDPYIMHLNIALLKWWRPSILVEKATCFHIGRMEIF